MVDISPFKELYPFKSNFIKINGYHYHYVDESQGEILLMLHGNPTWSFYYRNLISHFSKNYRVIAPDHLGCGLSDKPQDYNYTLENHIKNLTLLIDYLKLEKITLFMHDWGGPIGMGYAINHREKFKRFVIFNTAVFLKEGLDMPWQIKLAKTPIGAMAIRFFNAFARGALLFATTKKLTKQIKAGYLAPYNSYANRIAILRFVQDIPWSIKAPSYPLFKLMDEKIKIFKDHPMLIIWGERDFCFTLKFLAVWKNYFPQAQIKTIPEAGHYVVEDGDEKFIPWIEEFLNNS